MNDTADTSDRPMKKRVIKMNENEIGSLVRNVFI